MAGHPDSVRTVADRQLDRSIARLAVPAFGALLAQPLFLLVDAVIVGTLGTEALAGLGAASTIFGAVVGQALDGTIVPMTTAMGLAGILCLLSNRLLVPRR